MTRTNILLLLGVVALILFPLFWVKNQEDSFGGADGQAEEAIIVIQSDYQPWAQPFWEPPSSEIESLLFGLQAALGSGLIFYCLGVYRGKKMAIRAKECNS